MEFISLSTDGIRTRGLQIPPEFSRSGLYRLTLPNGDTYWGETRNIILRVGSHRRAYDQIAKISYSPVPSANLESAAREDERGGRQKDINRAHPPATAESRRLAQYAPDLYLDRIRWIEENVPEEGDPRQSEPPGQRERTLPLYQRLVAHPEFETIRELVSLYLERVVPAPRETERRNWVITSMPSTARTRVWRRLLCLSVNNVEALTIGEQFDGKRWSVTGFMSAAACAGATQTVLPTAARRSGAFIAPVYYRTVGDVSQIGFDSLAALQPLLESDRVLDLVGGLVMRLMRRGRGMYGRFHDYHLADAVLNREIASVDEDLEWDEGG